MDKLTDEFRGGLARGELLVQSCKDCSKLNMYPRFACPFCQSEELGWVKAGGAGLLKSFTVCRIGAPIGFEDDLPYALGVVLLEEGVQLLGRLVPSEDGNWDHYQCDESVQFFTEGSTGPSDRPIAWFNRVSE